MRNNYGKGVAYGEVDGRGVIFYTSPAFFLHALDAKTGEHLENWGTPVPIRGFPATGVIDMLPDLVKDWAPWTESGLQVRPGTRHPARARQSLDLVAADRRQRRRRRRQRARAGLLPDPHREHPRRHPGLRRRAPASSCGSSTSSRAPASSGTRPGRTTRGRRTGDVSSWAPMSADPGARARLHSHQPADHRLLRRLPARRQPVRHQHPRARRQDRQARLALPDRAPRHLELRQPDRAGAAGRERSTARRTPIVVQTTKQGFAYTFNRETGEPDLADRRASGRRSRTCPARSCRRRSRFPTKPKAFEIQELTEDNLIDFTPELRKEALAIIRNYKTGPLFNPPIQVGHPSGKRSFVSCPSGASNIYAPTVADPETGIVYREHASARAAPRTWCPARRWTTPTIRRPPARRCRNGWWPIAATCAGRRVCRSGSRRTAASSRST